jgi:MFS family permease
MTQQVPERVPTADARETAEPPRSSMRRIGLASYIGTLVEFYDFQIYATAAALVFPHLFFPALGASAATVASFATLGVAFVARPLGSILFGHFGDRLGRKRTLVATLLVMGTSTVLIGAMPTAAQIGVAAPVLLTLLRFLQGLAAGGEWSGATLFASESSSGAKRGVWAVMPMLGGSSAVMLAAITFLATGYGMSDAAFASWGWRIPFLGSVLLLAVGLWIRLRTEETPVFRKQVDRGGTSTAPFLEAFRSQPRQILVAAGVEISSFALLYTGTSFIVNYGVQTLSLSRTAVLGVGIGAGATMAVGNYLGARVSDRLGRRRVMLIVTGAGVVWSLLLFPILNVGTIATFAVGVTISTFIAGLGFGPTGALMSELFHTRYRYTAAGFCYSVAGIIGAALPPLVAGAIVASFGSFAFGAFMALLALVSFVCCLALRETRGRVLDETLAPEPAEGHAA